MSYSGRSRAAVHSIETGLVEAEGRSESGFQVSSIKGRFSGFDQVRSL